MENEVVTLLEEMRKNNEPLSWGFVKEHFKSENFYGYRSKSVEEDYENYKKNTEKKWEDVGSLIKHKVFGMKSSDSNWFVGKLTVKESIKGYYFIILFVLTDYQ